MYLKFPFFYQDSTLPQKFQLLLQIFFQDSPSQKGHHDHSPRLWIQELWKQENLWKSFGFKWKLLLRSKEKQKCFDRQPTIWHISNSEWQLVLEQTWQESGFEINLQELKSIIQSMHKVFPSSVKTDMMQESEWSQIGILQKPQNMLSITTGTSVCIWLHAVRAF